MTTMPQPFSVSTLIYGVVVKWGSLAFAADAHPLTRPIHGFIDVMLARRARRTLAVTPGCSQAIVNMPTEVWTRIRQLLNAQVMRDVEDRAVASLRCARCTAGLNDPDFDWETVDKVDDYDSVQTPWVDWVEPACRDCRVNVHSSNLELTFLHSRTKV